MPAKPKHTFPVAALVIVIIAVVFGIGVLIGGFTLKSIAENTHTYTAFGQHWTATPVQGWGTIITTCHIPHTATQASYVTTEENTSSSLHFVATTPRSGGQVCEFNTGLDLTLESVDLRNYSAGRIHRTLTLSFDGGNRATYLASINDLLTDTNIGSAGLRDSQSFDRTYGDITWTNDGNTITLKGDEYPNGKLITIGSSPITLHLSEMISTSSASNSHGIIDLSITGLDLVPMPASVTKAPTTIPVPVTTQPVVLPPAGGGSTGSVPSTEVPIPVEGVAPSWWQDFLTGLRGAWHQFLGWFGVNA